jgi:hypothetical protein
MSKIVNLIGKRFGKLTVLRRADKSSGGSIMWRCKCDCGSTLTVQGNNLKSGHTKSCGCIRRFSLGYKDGHIATKLYKVWSQMKDRCNNTNNGNYQYYGGKGIVICEEWSEFNKFHSWAYSNGYKEGLTIDRVDSNKNYCPANCRWVPQSVQVLNRQHGKGVSWEKRKKRWRARFQVQGKSKEKHFKDYDEAINWISTERPKAFQKAINNIINF